MSDKFKDVDADTLDARDFATQPAEAAPPREWFAVLDSVEENEDGSIHWAEGMISTHGGGNLVWETEQISFVEKSAYDRLADELRLSRLAHEGSVRNLQKERDQALREVERLKQLCDTIKTLESMNEDGYEKKIAHYRQALERIEAKCSVTSEVGQIAREAAGVISRLWRCLSCKYIWRDDEPEECPECGNCRLMEL
jgi:rubrerythrin